MRSTRAKRRPGPDRAGSGRRGGDPRLPRARGARVRAPPSSRGTARPGRRRVRAPRTAWGSRRRPNEGARHSTRRSSRAASGPGARRSAIGERRVEPDQEREARRRIADEIASLPVTRSHPPRVRLRALDAPGRVRAHAREPPAQEGRRHQRRRQHDEQQRGVEIVAEHAFSSPIVAKINPTSPRGSIPSPMRRLSPGAPDAPTAATSLPTTATTSRAPAIPEHFRFDERLDSGLDADLEEEHRDEQVTDGRELALDPLRRGATARARDRPRTRRRSGASLAASASSANASVNASASATSVPADRA